MLTGCDLEHSPMTIQRSPRGPSLSQVRISDQVADHIVRYIAKHRLQPGDSLPSENELTRLFGVSRPTVREATNTLAGGGLIAIASGKSPTVLSLSKDPFSNLVRHGLATRQVTMIQVLEIRRSLEVQAAAFAAEHRTEADIEALNTITGKLPGVVGNVEAFSRLDMAFHEALARAAQNALLSAILAGIADIAVESARSGLSRARNEREWDFILRIHQRIAAAIVAGNAADARRQMTAHFASALGRLRRD